MAEAYYIVDWELHYEVNDHGSPWEANGKNRKRKTPLPWSRRYTYGPRGDNQAYEDVADITIDRYGEAAWPVAWGLFNKLVEIAARQKPTSRGYVLGRGQKPIAMRALMRITRFTEEQIQLGLEALCDPEVRWVEERPWPVPATDDSGNVRELPDSPGDSGNPRKVPERPGTPGALSTTLPEIPGTPGAFQEQESEPEHNSTEEHNETEREPEDSEERAQEEDSGSEKQGQQLRFKAHQTAQAIREAVGLNARGPPTKQQKADITSICIMANHVYLGHAGRVDQAAQATLDKAKQVGRSPARKRMAVLMAWFKKRLKANGHAWQDAIKAV